MTGNTNIFGKWLAFGFCVFMLASCNKNLNYFTQRMNDENGWSEQELKKVQFYLSDDIVLRRQLGASDSRISNGKIRIENGREIEEVRFEKGTPGVVVFSPKANRLAVSFESSDDRYLIFGPNPKVGNRYTLRGKEWSRYQGKVTYDGRVYETSSRSAMTALLVDLKRANNTDYKSKTVGGRKVRG